MSDNGPCNLHRVDFGEWRYTDTPGRYLVTCPDCGRELEAYTMGGEYSIVCECGAYDYCIT